MKNSEPCTYSPEPVADCLPTSSSDTSPSALSSGMPTAAKSCASEPPMDGSPVCECTKETFGCSIHPNTPAAWIASQRDSLARTLAALDAELVSAKEPAAGFTAKSCVSLASFDRATSGWKTSQQSFPSLEPSSVIWPRWGMTVAGVAYAHPQSERPIVGIAGGVSPQWATPQAHDARNGYAERVGRFGTKHGARNLNDEVKMWPTPSVAGNYNRAGSSAKSGDGLATAVLHCPTPSSNDWKGSSKPGHRRGQLTDPAIGVIPAGGQLNPTWVEWLMAWPLGFTVSKLSGMAKSRSKPQPRGASLEGPE